ncbi:MAG: diguanylate cyclase [Acidobacteriota bacterium]|nr:diguanylate cyclase [Acidobacteriota bacterium]
MAEATKRLDRTEIARHVDRAEKLLQKGKTADALTEYLQVLAGDSGNDMVRQMAADLHLALQQIPPAVVLLGELFDHQVQAGDATRASLTYKKLTRFANPTIQQKLRFGQLLENSNRKLAAETYESVLQEATASGRKAECFNALQRLIILEPTERNILRFGEMSSELGHNKDAASAFMKLAELKGANGEGSAWVERAYSEYSSDPKIALAYAKGLLKQEQSGAAIFVLEPLANAEGAAAEFKETYADALVAASRFGEAAPLVWQMFEQNPSRMGELSTLIGQMIDAEQDDDAIALAKKLEEFQRKKGERRAFLAMMQKMASSHRASAKLLEYMSELFNGSNRETDYSQTLIKLYGLYFELGNFDKAGEALDRAAEVDPYESGHQKRLQDLHGKIDEKRYQVIASRFSSAASSGETSRDEEKTLGASTLQDLMLQAEILVQYGMRPKALERLQRVQELFPHEEERNPDLHQLYLAVGLTPQYSSADVKPFAAVSSTPVQISAPAATMPPSSEAAEVNSFTRVSEITRKLYRQGNADAVLSTTVAEIGSQWKLSRCVAAMCKPGSPPTALKEFCGENIKAGNSRELEGLATSLQELVVSKGSLIINDAKSSNDLHAVQATLKSLNVGSLLALMLSDGPDPVGMLILTYDASRVWSPSDVLVLKTISEQIVIALNNAGLRRLVKSLSVTDEHSGLLKRASYVDLLMAETRRAVQQKTAVTVLLARMGEPSTMMKEFGEEAVESAMQQIGKLLAANMRQNDLAFRYERTTIAIVLGETAEKEAMLAAQKLNGLVGAVRLGEKQTSLPFIAGLAEAVVRPDFDPVDVVTEVINRAETALDAAALGGHGNIVLQSAAFAAAAVA